MWEERYISTVTNLDSCVYSIQDSYRKTFKEITYRSAATCRDPINVSGERWTKRKIPVLVLIHILMFCSNKFFGYFLVWMYFFNEMR